MILWATDRPIGLLAALDPRAAYVVHATLQAPRKYLDALEQADGKSGIRLCSFGELTPVVVDDTQRS